MPEQSTSDGEETGQSSENKKQPDEQDPAKKGEQTDSSKETEQPAFPSFFSTEGLKEIRGLTEKSYDKMARDLRIFIYSSILIILVSFIFAPVYLVIKPSGLIVETTLIVILVFLMIVFILAFIVNGQLMSEREYFKLKKKAKSVPCSRYVPLEINQDTKKSLSTSLLAIKKKVYDKTKGYNNTLKEDQIRVNVMIPDASNRTLEVPCVLKFLPDMYFGKYSEDETSITFRMNEGLSGRVFLYNQRLGTFYNGTEWEKRKLDANGARINDELFPLTGNQKARISKDLLWVISFPLIKKADGRDNVYGVLNIDGLGFKIDPVQITELADYLQKDIDKFSKEMGIVQMGELVIDVRDVKR